MIKSYGIDLKLLFKKFYCPFCGEELTIKKISRLLTEEEKKQYYKKMFTFGIPINIDVEDVKRMFICPKCGYCNTRDNQLLIHKEQKRLKKKIIGE